MNRNSIRWRLPVSYAVIAFLAAISLGSVMLLVLRNYYADQERAYLEGNAFTLKPVIEQIMRSDVQKIPLKDQINALAFLSQAQIRLLDVMGNVLVDSGIPTSRKMVAVSGGGPIAGNVMFSTRVESSADQGPVLIYRNDKNLSLPAPDLLPLDKQTQSVQPGKTADIILSVNASPYGYGFVARAEPPSNRHSSQSVSVMLTGTDGNKLGTLEFSHGPSYGADVISSVVNAWIIASIFAIAIAALAGWFMSQRVTRPVLALENATHQMEQGNLSVRVDLPNERQQEFISLAKSFNGMAEQVEQTVSTLREFVADAAHELHTPLTALQANLELAREAKNTPERILYLARAKEQSQRLEELVQSLLDLSRIEARASEPEFAPVDILQLVREVGEQFASRTEQADRIFTMQLPDAALLIQGNETQLRQVVINLLENALKFTPANGTIALALEKEENEIKLTVSDSGIGIPSDDLPHLFERFHRGRNASEYPGNGLGLAIVKAIVNLHKGDITAQSEEKRGTTVSLSLPMAPG